MKRWMIGATAVAAAAGAAQGQSNIDAARKFAWKENCGWLNWRDAGSPAGAQGVRVHATFLSGFAWGENIGWINFGDGTPGGGASYSNASGADHGVNVLAGGDLSGFAWGENIGWINFGTASLGAQRARFDAGAGRFRGYAWGENVGRVNLDDGVHFVKLACYPDCNGDGALNLADFGCFQTKFALADPYADCNGDGNLNLADFGCFQTRFALGCP